MQDYKISGVGTIYEGQYNIIKISGSAKATGHIKAKEILISGAAQFDNDVEADFVKISGVGNFKQNLKTSDVRSAGMISVNGSLDSESVTITGIIKINGDINTDRMLLDTDGSTLNNIYGDSITIKSKNSKVKLNDIEATKIYLDNVQAHQISGNIVEVYGYSVIDIIEYSEILKLHDTCKVEKIVKINLGGTNE